MNADGSGPRTFARCSVRPRRRGRPTRGTSSAPTTRRGSSILDTVDGTVDAAARTAGATPSWSPDGATIAFVDEYKLYVIPATGGTRRRLGILKAAEFAAPMWSPDSGRVAYVSLESGDRYSLWTIRADGSGGRRLAQNVAEDTPSWSPDGSRIAFVKVPPPRRQPQSSSLAQRRQRRARGQLQPGRRLPHGTAWSADGLVLYSRGRFRGSQESDIFAVAPSGARSDER